ncbi:MAG: DUF881 domain-containing protein [Eubacteriales bacterium]|nr:DUF881 domain-containing protein [Eubacteriales bacterium]
MISGKNISIAAVLLILGIMLSWQYKSLNERKAVIEYENKREEQLKEELQNEKANNELLAIQIENLRDEIGQYQAAQGDIDQNLALLNKELDYVKMIAGFYPVKGKGVIVTMDSKPSGEYGKMTENDVLRVINEMRAADIQAISVNGERLMATSEIKEAGGYFIINGRQVLPPIEIRAIADPSNVEYALNMTGGLLKRIEAYVDVSIKKSDEVLIPAVRNIGTVVRTDLMIPVQ